MFIHNILVHFKTLILYFNIHPSNNKYIYLKLYNLKYEHIIGIHIPDI